MGPLDFYKAPFIEFVVGNLGIKLISITKEKYAEVGQTLTGLAGLQLKTQRIEYTDVRERETFISLLSIYLQFLITIITMKSFGFYKLRFLLINIEKPLIYI